MKLCLQQLQRRNDSELLLFFLIFDSGTLECLNLPGLMRVYEKCVCKAARLFFSPGIVALSDARGPAADPPGPDLGASGSGALCGAGGVFTQQVNSLVLLSTVHLFSLLFVLASYLRPTVFLSARSSLSPSPV